MEVDEILHQIRSLGKKVQKLSREIESVKTASLKDSYSLENLLKMRGLRIFRKDPGVRLLFPPELALPQKSRFFEMMKKYSFRLVLRDMIKQQSQFRVQDLTHYQVAEKVNFSGCSKMPRCKAPEILRNEAYLDVRRNDEG